MSENELKNIIKDLKVPDLKRRSDEYIQGYEMAVYRLELLFDKYKSERQTEDKHLEEDETRHNV